MKCGSLHTAYPGGETPGTVFTWHMEGYHLYSTSYQIDGAEKVWLIVPPFKVLVVYTITKLQAPPI